MRFAAITEPAGMKEFPIHFTQNQRGCLHVPNEMTAQNFELLKTQVENALAVIQSTAIRDEPTDEPKPTPT